ncbi:MAG TPA: PKD domain-containing protein, partial [Chitinophagaceae bacterium]|nr:PKD domain-containing protein [Chitinophagaceae bacterium]
MSSFTCLTYSATRRKAPGSTKDTGQRLRFLTFLVGMLLMISSASAQIIAESGTINEICPSCTSGDVRIEKVFLVDGAGVPVTASCTPGALMSNLYLQFNLNVISQTRYGFLITGDLYVNNVFVKKIYQCYAQTFNQGPSSVKIEEPLTFNGGQPIEIRNAFTAWSQSAPTVPGVYDVCNRYNPVTNTYDCASLSPKCYQYPYNIRVVGPLVADFSYTGTCAANTGVQAIQFNDKTTGGELAYTYSWNFGDGTTSTQASPSKTYAAAGTYSVTLTVTDNNVPVKQVNTRTYNVVVGSCCDFNVSCPANTDLGTFNCTNFNTIPAIPTTIAQLKAAPYNINMGSYPCGTLRFSASDNATAVQCSASQQNITRTITVYDDKNNDGDLDADEPSHTCTFTYSVNASIPSAPFATGASRCGAGTLVLTASGCTGGTLRWYDKDGNLVGTGASFETPVLSATATYYVSCLNCCESEKTPVTATVNAAPVVVTSGNVAICSGASTVLTASGGTSYLWSNGATTSFITVNPAATTDYSVEVSNAEGCKDSKTITVTVNPLPVIDITGNTVICFGGNTVLTASGGATYKWSNGATTASVNVNPAATTTYTVEVTTAAGCKASKSVTVTVNDKPIVNISGKAEICAGEETTLTASGGASFVWSTGETTASITVKPAATTTYSVDVTSGANCQASKSIQVVVNPLPVVSLTQNSAICYGEKITLTASGGASYKWSNGATTSSIEVAPTETTSYSVEVSSSKGCSSVKSTTVTVNPLPVINIAGNTVICFGGSTVLTASGG